LQKNIDKEIILRENS